jgi:hypothetical protein
VRGEERLTTTEATREEAHTAEETREKEWPENRQKFST